MGGITFSSKKGTERDRLRTRLSLNKMREILQASGMINTNHKRYMDFILLIKLTEQEL